MNHDKLTYRIIFGHKEDTGNLDSATTMLKAFYNLVTYLYSEGYICPREAEVCRNMYEWVKRDLERGKNHEE